MNRITLSLADMPNCSNQLVIGRRGENEATQILLDYSEWIEDYGSGAMFLYVLRHSDQAPYPVYLDLSDGIATWTVSATDTNIQGQGIAEYVYIVDEAIVKTVVFPFYVDQDIGQPVSDPPDPYETWVEQLIELGAQAEAAALEAIAAKNAAEAAQAAAETAQGKAETAQTAAESAKTAAENAASSAAGSATAAAGSATSAAGSATAAQAAKAAAESAKAAAAASASSASSSATAATGSATSAANSATAAQTAKTAAENAKTAAAASASSASSSATAAAGSATDAASSATAAAGSATSASGSANTASAKATEATQAATAAAGSATQAAGSATAAQAAQTAAEAAQDAAEDAQTAAETAQTAAESAAESVEESAAQIATNTANIATNTAAITQLNSEINDLTNNKAPIITDTASGAIASFPDGADGLPVKQLTVQVNPVQDLHGYDNPWPAGGGKNKVELPYFSAGYCAWASLLDNETAMLAELNKLTAGDYVISGEFELTERNNTSDASKFGILFFYGGGLTQYIGNNTTSWGTSGVGSKKTYTAQATITSEMAGTFSAIRAYGCGIAGQGSSGKAKINKLQIESGTTATSYAPYSNECPISGWTGCEVTRTGKNLCDESKLLQASGWTVADGVYSGLNSALFTAFRAAKGFPGVTYFKPDTQYTVSFMFKTTTASKNTIVGFVYTDGTSSYEYCANLSWTKKTITSTSGKSIKWMYWEYGSNDTCYISELQVEEGTTATDYASYQGQTLPITFPDSAGTVYGAELKTFDDGTGKLIVDHAEVDLGTLSWSGYAGYTGLWYANNTGLGFIEPNNNTLPSAICSNYKGAISRTIGNAGHKMGEFALASPQRIYIADTSYSTVGEFKAAMSGVQLVYELATPIEYTLTAEQVGQLLTLKGENNIWSDCNGDTTVEYRADTKLYIDKKLAAMLAALS